MTIAHVPPNTITAELIFWGQLSDELLKSDHLTNSMAKVVAASAQELGETRVLDTCTFADPKANKIGICFLYHLGEGERLDDAWEQRHVAHFKEEFGDHYRALHFHFGERALEVFQNAASA